MKKRLIAMVLALCCLFGSVSPALVYATEAEICKFPDYDTYQNFIAESYPILYRDRLYLKALDAYSGFEWCLDGASWLIGENLSVDRCTEILANMVTLINYQLEEAIVEQASIDTTMTLYDYGVNAADIATGLVGTETLKKAGNTITERIATTMELANGVLDVTVDTKEKIELLAQLEGDYSMQYAFLDAVYVYTDIPEMKEAAKTLMLANAQIMLHKLEVFNSTTSSATKFAAHDVFLDQIAEDLLNDPDFFDSNAWLGVKALSTAFSLYSGAELAFNITLFMGDVLFGTHDTYNRYNEMVAMRAIRQALLHCVTSNSPLVKKDYDTLDRNILLLKMVLYVDIRGEYCAYKMVTEDGKLATLIRTSNGKTIDENYSASIDFIKGNFELLDGLYIEQETKHLTGVEIPISKNEQYKLNIFLSNFSEQWFNEVYIWDENSHKRILASERFESQTADSMDLVNFAWLYAKLNTDSIEKIQYGGDSYYGINIDTINSITQQFFDRSIHLEDIQSEIKDTSNSFQYRVINNAICTPAAAGETYNNMTIAEKAYDLGNGKMRITFSIYSITDIGGSNSIVLSSGTIQDKKVYYYSSKEADTHRYFEYHLSGVAVVQPHKTESGKETYQLISYELSSDKKYSDPSDSFPEKEGKYDADADSFRSYKQILKQYSESAEYTLYDINKDGTYELIVNNGSRKYHIYSLSGSTAILCGSCYAYNGGLYAFEGNGLIAHDGGSGYQHLEHVSLYTLSDNTLEDAKRIINTADHSVEELYNCLNQYSPITNFYPVSDYSLLESQ